MGSSSGRDDIFCWVKFSRWIGVKDCEDNHLNVFPAQALHKWLIFNSSFFYLWFFFLFFWFFYGLGWGGMCVDVLLNSLVLKRRNFSPTRSFPYLVKDVNHGD